MPFAKERPKRCVREEIVEKRAAVARDRRAPTMVVACDIREDHDPDVVERAVAGQLKSSALCAEGARDNPTIGRYRPAFTMTPQDVAAV